MNNKETFYFHKQSGLFEHLTAEMRIEQLVSMLIDALYIPVEHGAALKTVDKIRLDHFGVDANEPINFGALNCVSVEEKNGVFEVTIDEAAPNDCPTLCEYIEKYMSVYGWNVSVVTEW